MALLDLDLVELLREELTDLRLEPEREESCLRNARPTSCMMNAEDREALETGEDMEDREALETGEDMEDREVLDCCLETAGLLRETLLGLLSGSIT